MDWTDILERVRRLGRLKADKVEVEARLAGFQTQLNQQHDETRELREEVEEIRQTVEAFVSSFERQLDELAQRGRGASQQADRALKSLRRDLNTYIEVLESVVRGQMDIDRRREIDKLISSAKSKRTRITNEIKRRAANDA